MKRDRIEVFAGKTEAELEALTVDLDREFIADKFRPLSPADRKLWGRAKRKRGRPRVGKGAKVVSVSIERSLLQRSDRAARRLGTTRARLVAAGLERVLTIVERTGARLKRQSKTARRRAA